VYAPEKAVTLRLKSSTDVGALAADRVYPLRAPSTSITADHYTYRRVSTVSQVTHSTGGPKWQRARLQLDSWSQTYGGAKALAKAARQRLVGYRGSTGGVQVWTVTLETELDIDEGLSGDDRWFRVMQDYGVEARVSS